MNPKELLYREVGPNSMSGSIPLFIFNLSRSVMSVSDLVRRRGMIHCQLTIIAYTASVYNVQRIIIILTCDCNTAGI